MSNVYFPHALYICDGKKGCGKSSGCFLNGGECHHTTTLRNALNGTADKSGGFDEFRFEKRVFNGDTIYWERC